MTARGAHSLSSGDMQVRRRRVAEVEVVAVGGDVDLSALPSLHQTLARAVDDAAGPVVVELDGATFVDDAALGVIVGAAARARRRDVPFSIVCTEPRLVDRLADTRIDQIIPVTDGIAGS